MMLLPQKRSITAALSILLTAAAILLYGAVYQTPSLRFAHRIFPLTAQSDTGREYQKDGYAIHILELPEQTEIHFYSADGEESRFYVAQENYTVTAYNEQRVAALSGYWQGNRLCDPATKKTLPEYEKMLLRQKTEHFAPEAADAIYIYKSYPHATRGGKRAPMLIFAVILVGLIAAANADSRPPLPRAKDSAERLDFLTPRMEYSSQLLKDYGKKEISPETKAIERKITGSIVLVLAACIAVALYDVLCY